MKFVQATTFLAFLASAGAAASPIIGWEDANEKIDEYMKTPAMAGAASTSITSTSLPIRRGGLKGLVTSRETVDDAPFIRSDRHLRKAKRHGKKGEDGTCKKGKDLDSFAQWRGEVGYWIGEYTLLQGDGTPNESSTWPYPYDSYKGFISGNIKGGSYRQRNIFMYPPQTAESCTELAGAVVGSGTCGTNGNSVVFSADQSGCSMDGSISGSFFVGPFPIDTTTELIGADNALLYQVFSGGQMTQSQLTTLSQGGERRTRTAQTFAFGTGDPGGTSYYRERKVTMEEFYEELSNVITTYNVLEEDLCGLDGFTRQHVPDYTAGLEQCKAHIEQSFEL
jgi:hypothetical protein